MSTLRKYLIIQVILLISIVHWSYSQKTDFQNIENVKLATDRSLYLSGEQIWYSASYTLNPINSQPLSKLLYVELFDNEQKLVVSQKVTIKNGIANGMIPLSEQLVSGYYILRAYTRYQENFPVWQMTMVILSIVNPDHPLPAASLPEFDDQFLITGMPDGSIAYRLIGPIHREVQNVHLFVNGFEKELDSGYFSNGIGRFNYKNSIEDSLQLQVILNSGDTINSKMISLQKPESNVIVENQDFAFMDIATLKITNSPPGELIIQPGEEINIDISNLEPSDYPLSISMTSRGVKEISSSLIPDFLVDNPQYINSFYRSGIPSVEIQHQVDILLALYGNKIIKEMSDESSSGDFIVPELNGMTIQGKVINTENGEPIANELVYCSLLGKENQFHTARTTSNGRFVVQLNDISHLNDIYLGTKPTNETSREIIVDNGFCRTPPIWFSSSFFLDSSNRELITRMFMARQVNNIYCVTTNKKNPKNISYIPVFGDNLEKIRLSDYVQLSSTPEVINEIVPYVRAKKRDGNYIFIVLDDKLNIKYEDPLLFVDNVPYDNINELMELQPTEIDMVEVATHKYMYGNEEFNGIISITTSNGKFAGLPLSDDGVFVEYGGVEEEIEFVPNTANEKFDKPDVANTLFWTTLNTKPNNGLSLIAPSIKGNYSIVITSLSPKRNVVLGQNVIVK